MFFFFFQAEDGIRDIGVTGVQTCALPISRRGGLALLLFLAVVAMGAPLLASGAGGLGVFVGPTAGYLYSWPIAAFVIGWLTERFWRRGVRTGIGRAHV